MPFFRPASRALSHLLRHDPFHHSSPASLFSRHSPFTPLARAFDDPFFSSPFSAPLYTVYEVRDEDNHTSNNTNANKTTQPQLNKPEETKTAEPQQQQQQQQQRSADNRLTRQDDNSHRQRWLDRRANRRQRHSHHHHPLSLLASPFESLLASPFYAASSYQPLEITLDLYSTPTAYQVNAAIPGVRKEDIKLTVDDGVLTIEAERREERGRPNTSSNKASATASTSAASAATGADAKPVEVDVKADTVSTSSGDNNQHATQATQANSTPAQSQPQQQQQQSTAAAEQHQQQEAEEDEVSVHHVESYYGRVSRSLALPDDVNVEGLTARYEDGVLKIELPRVEEKRQQAKQISIQ